MTEFVLNGKVLGSSVEIDGTTYPKSEFANLPQLSEVRPTPTLLTSQTMDWSSGAMIDGKWQRFTVRDKTNDELLSAIRAERNRLLAETDWTASTDVTMTAEMTVYRQALRDLPANTDDLFNPVYPDKPK
jgi:hypothetical protein